MHRDPKKSRKAFTHLDFSFFKEEVEGRVEERAAAAYMKLANDDLLPDWAVFCAQDFISGDGKRFDTDPALIGENFMLLAPLPIDGGFEGLMIATKAASKQLVVCTYEGERYRVQVPEITGNFGVAEAGVQVDALMLSSDLTDALRSE